MLVRQVVVGIESEQVLPCDGWVAGQRCKIDPVGSSAWMLS